MNSIGLKQARRGWRERDAARRRRRLRPSVMALEGRTLLSSTTWTVNSLGDTGTGSGNSGDLRYCITQADQTPGDNTIKFSVSGTIQLTTIQLTPGSSIGPLELQNTSGDPNQTITITGGNTVNGSGYGDFVVEPGVTATIRGLIITNGGCGVDNYGTLLLQSCLIEGNSLGGVVNSAGALSMINCTVTGNVSLGGGGGLFNDLGATATLDYCTISDNITAAALVNPKPANGGGLCNRGTLSMTDCTVSGNSAYASSTPSGDGGGLENHGTAKLTDCTVSGNSAGTTVKGGTDRGGGLLNSSPLATLILTNCTISGNKALKGGGLDNLLGQVTLTNCTVSGNNSEYGGGLYNHGAATLINTIVAGNSVGDVDSSPPITGATDTT